MSTRRRFLKDSVVLLGAASMWPRDLGAQTVPFEFDYIIVGAGSSGSVLANRLSASGEARVLLVEAGGPVANHPLVPVPGQWTSLIGSDLDWQYQTEPSPALGGRRVAWPRGKAYGGSSTINAMAYVRGHQLCFDDWARAAGSAWSYRSVLPIFRSLEDNSRGTSDYLGAGGPLAVSDQTDPHEGHLAFLEAARSLGFRADPRWNFNAASPENGAGFYQKNIRDGRRHSAADAFLRPALGRPNLTAWPNTLTRRVLFENARATGIECVRGGEVARARATRGVIIAAGVIESPKLLMLSGVGPADHLREKGIAVVADRAQVGANLHDHPRVSMRWAAQRTLAPSSVSAGLLAFSGHEPAPRMPDLQFYVGRGTNAPDDSVTLTIALSRIRSRGSIELRSDDPVDPPVIRPNYFADSRDLFAIAAGLELARELASASAYTGLRGAALAPDDSVRNGAELRAFVLATSETMFHPAGTCRMGSDEDSVVDPQLRVRGVDRLWVADGSVMPTVVNSQTHAACLLIASMLRV